jgi:hypothetical protein
MTMSVALRTARMGNFTATFVPAPDMGHDSWKVERKKPKPTGRWVKLVDDVWSF